MVQLDGVEDTLLEAGATGFDFETATSHSITVQATSEGETTLNRAFIITVTDVAEGGAFDDDDYAAWMVAA